jgi:hypothetical protein
MRNFYTDNSLVQLICNSALSQYQDVLNLLEDMKEADLTCNAQCDRVLQKVCDREPLIRLSRLNHKLERMSN